MLLSKSDFKVARTCGTKLFYRKSRYPSLLTDDPYLEFLADGGYMVETIAKLFFPEGMEVPFDSTEDAIRVTREALSKENVTLFEATFAFAGLLARVDILEKRGNQFHLIEVKAKGFRREAGEDSPFRGKRGIRSKWLPYLEDVAFQTHILTNLYPGAKIIPCLCLVDKSKTCGTETNFSSFEVVPREKPSEDRPFTRPEVRFKGDMEALKRESFLEIIDVGEIVNELLPTVAAAATQFSASIARGTVTKIPPTLGINCKDCEYRREDPEKNGFRECWGDRANPAPHLLDFYRVDQLGSKGQIAEEMIARGQCGVKDISPGDLKDNPIGKRQAMQLEGTLQNREIIDPELAKFLGSCRYPLQFIDFEASRTAVPYHAGMHPYEQVAFQWSCHTIQKPGDDLAHAEWINIEHAFPNFEFARSLRKVIDLEGTVFVWSGYEKATLSEIRKQLDRYGEADPELAAWLDRVILDTGPLVDLCDLARKYYFHPQMGGSVSIKQVLPAVWNQSSNVRNHPWFARYLRTKEGKILEPYDTLDLLPFKDDALEDEGEAVHEGTGAIRTYQEMMYGLHSSDPAYRNTKKQLLLNYCKLDTAAMVMIWMHWTSTNHRIGL